MLAPNGHAEAVVTCPLGEDRKSLPTFKMTAFDPGPDTDGPVSVRGAKQREIPSAALTQLAIVQLPA
jgi:hypothetical protein